MGHFDVDERISEEARELFARILYQIKKLENRVDEIEEDVNGLMNDAE